jgi:YD repeat-containing protein
MLFAMLFAGLAAGAETIKYAYDPMGRLTRTESGDAAVWVYAYETMGNRLAKTTTRSPLEVGKVLSSDGSYW